METGRRWGARHSRGWGRLVWERPELREEWWRLTAVGMAMCGLGTLAILGVPPTGTWDVFSTSFFSSSMSLLNLARLFWNQQITWKLIL